MKLTDEHINGINDVMSGRHPNPEQHYLNGWTDDWMLYGTGTAQLTYLAVLDVVAEVMMQEQDGVTHPAYLYRRNQISGRKEVLPNVSNYWVQFNRDSVRPWGTGDNHAPVELRAGQFPTADSGDFFGRFNASPWSLSNEVMGKLVLGAKKHRSDASDVLDPRVGEVKDLLRQFAVRRACKFLIFDAIRRQHRIRYALDDLNLEMAATRARKDDKVPVCTSELRELFRTWDYTRDYVTFYLDLMQVPPPWQAPTASPATIQAWGNYAAHRANKVLSGDPGGRPQHVLDRLETCVDHALAGRYAEAIREYHDSRPSVYGKAAGYVNGAVMGME
jgi:hypothetical protein